MPRTHGRIQATIWNDPDFIGLEAGPQRLYLFLLSQPDLSHAGLVPMRIRRWAKKVRHGTAASVTADLGDLEDARFVITDEDTEEVLIRTFVRNDGVYKQPKVMLRLREDARQIESPTLRSAFRVELDRLPLHELTTARAAVESIVDDLRADFAEAGYPSEGVSDTPSWSSPPEETGKPDESDNAAGQNPSERVSGRVSDTPRVRAGALPHPPATVPQPPAPVPPTAGRGEPGDDVALFDQAPTAQTLVGEWIDHCPERPPGRVIGQVAKELKTLLNEGIAPERVRAALAEWNRKGLHPSSLASVVHEIANKAPTTRGQQATNDLFDRAMQRAIARQEAS